MTPGEFAAIEARADKLEYLEPCPNGCGCKYLDDADRYDCACSGPCCTVQVKFDGCKPFTATLLNEDPPNRIEVRDENGDVMFVHASIVTAAAAEGEKP